MKPRAGRSLRRVLCLLLAGLPSLALAAEAVEETSIHLLTMGPGDHLYTRFGHSALLVLKTRKGTKRYESAVYNYGDADFEAPGFHWAFFRGTVKFRLSLLGTLNQTVNHYAEANRTVTCQRLALSKPQIDTIVATLEHEVRPENRYYPYHYLKTSCATRIRDLLDRVLDGTLRRVLEAELDPHPVRHYARRGYAGHLAAELANDLFMGRLHDVPRSKYFSLYVPERLSLYLRQIQVPDPAGSGRRVPLLEAPDLLFERQGPPATVGEGRTLIPIATAWIVLVLGLGLFALRNQRLHPGRSGAWLLLWSLPLGLVALAMVFGAVFSTVAEGRLNELMLSFPVTDLLLIGVAVRWLRGRGEAGRLLRGYAVARLALVVLVLVGHATGILIQEPRVMVALALCCAGLLVAITRRFDQRSVRSGRTTAIPLPEA